MTILAIALFLIFGIRTSLRCQCTLLSPLNLFCVWFLFLFGLYEPFIVFFNIQISPKLPLVLAIGTGSVLVGLLMIPRVALLGLPAKVPPPQPAQIKYAKFFAIVFTVYWLVVSIANLRNSSSSDLSDLYSFSDASAGDDTASATPLDRILRFFIRPVLLSYLASLGFLARSHLKDRLTFIVAPVVIVTLSLLTAYTGRGNVIFMTAVCLILWCSLSPKRELLRIATLGFAAVVGFFLLQPLRHGHLSEGSFTQKDFVDSIGTGGEWEPVACLSDIIASRKDPDLFEIIQRTSTEAYYWLVNWVPRPLWVNKPETDFATRCSLEFYGHVYAQEAWTRNFTYIGQGYYLGNEPGVIFVGFLYGLSVAIALKVACRGAGWQGLYCYLLYEAVYLSRNCLTTWLFEACVTIGFGFLINQTVFKPRRIVPKETAPPAELAPMEHA